MILKGRDSNNNIKRSHLKEPTVAKLTLKNLFFLGKYCLALEKRKMNVKNEFECLLNFKKYFTIIFI